MNEQGTTTATVTVYPRFSTGDWLIESSFKLSVESYSDVFPIIVIDESGSMLYDIQAVVSGTRQLIKNYLENKCKEVVVIRYNSSATVTSFVNTAEAERFNACASGMTNFSVAIEKITSEIGRANELDRQPRAPARESARIA